MDDERLSIQERIAARRALREAQANGNRVPRQEPEAVTTSEPPKAAEPPAAPAEPVRRTEPAAPVPLPENVTPIVKRNIIRADAEPAKPVTPVPPVVEQAAAAPPTPVAELPTRQERIQKQTQDVSATLLAGLIEHMRVGEQLLLTRRTEGEWAIVMPTAAGNYKVEAAPSGAPKVERQVNTGSATGSGRTPTGFEESLWTQKYLDWVKAWRKMTKEQKVEECQKHGVELPDFALGDLICNMRMSMGIQAKIGLVKYKPEYSTVEARAEAKEKATKGLQW